MPAEKKYWHSQTFHGFFASLGDCSRYPCQDNVYLMFPREDYITLHYITLHYITLHYITLHYITLHYITLHYITLHYITYLPSTKGYWKHSEICTPSKMEPRREIKLSSSNEYLCFETDNRRTSWWSHGLHFHVAFLVVEILNQRWSYLDRLGSSTRHVPQKNFSESHILNPLLTKLVRSRWLDSVLVLFMVAFIDLNNLGP